MLCLPSSILANVGVTFVTSSKITSKNVLKFETKRKCVLYSISMSKVVMNKLKACPPLLYFYV